MYKHLQLLLMRTDSSSLLLPGEITPVLQLQHKINKRRAAGIKGGRRGNLHRLSSGAPSGHLRNLLFFWCGARTEPGSRGGGAVYHVCPHRWPPPLPLSGWTRRSAGRVSAKSLPGNPPPLSSHLLYINNSNKTTTRHPGRAT